MAELVYSAGLTSKLFWLQESRKTAGYILDGYSKVDIRKIAWEENIYQVKAEYRAYEVLNGTYRRVSALPEAVLQAFTTCDVETAKILNLIAILMDGRLFFEFFHEVYDEKLRLGEKEITDRALNVFFSDKALQSDVVAGWTDTAVRKLKRPIYWLFDSGKQNGFKALIYMHRYDADTVGRVRTDYLHKAQKYVETAMQSAQYTIDNAISSSEKSKATKAVTKYTKQLAEMKIYDEAIAYVANQRIEIDLDDGVKVNYAKFQGVEVAQEGKKALKVDLLAKI